MIRLNGLPIVFLGLTVVLIAGPDEQEKAIDTQRSSLTIHVGKAGLLSAAGHEHWVNAPIASGTVDDSSATPGVRFTVDARMLSVKAENGVNDKDQAEVQFNMQSKVLESSSYPQIVFQSTHVRPNGDDAWRVSGDLTLHGVTRPVILDVTRENDVYIGAVRIKQTEFGIQPIKIGGGVVKVKDELEIHFQVFTVSSLNRLREALCRSLGRIQERLVDTFENALFAKIGGLLATDAERGPRYGLQATPADVVAAMHASSECTVLNAEQPHRNALPQRRFTA